MVAAPAFFLVMGWIAVTGSGQDERIFRADLVRERAAKWVPKFAGAVDCFRRSSCGANLREINLALMQYAADHDDVYPAAKGNSTVAGWADSIYPYIQSRGKYHCSQTGDFSDGNPRHIDFTDYWLNANLSGLPRVRVTNPASNVSLGEGNNGNEQTSASYSKNLFPARWLNNPKGVPWRHLEDAVWARHLAWFVYADGHAKMLTAREVRERNQKVDFLAVH